MEKVALVTEEVPGCVTDLLCKSILNAIRKIQKESEEEK